MRSKVHYRRKDVAKVKSVHYTVASGDDVKETQIAREEGVASSYDAAAAQ